MTEEQAERIIRALETIAKCAELQANPMIMVNVADAAEMQGRLKAMGHSKIRNAES